MPVSRFDRLLVLLGTPLLLVAVTWAAAGAAPQDRPTLAALVAASTPIGSGLEAAVDGSSGRLPSNVRIDPDTLQLVGFDLAPDKGSVGVDWMVLGGYEYQDDLEGLPAEIRELDGQFVTMAGFLLPLYEFDEITEFNLVASHWSCCFGVPPGINGWVHVRLAPGHAGLRNSTEPLRIVGRFRVREQKEAGYVVSIYAIEDAKARVVGW